MKRPLALTGAVYFAMQLLAAFLPQAVLWPLAAFFVLGALLLRAHFGLRKQFVLAACTAAAALAAHAVYVDVAAVSTRRYIGEHTVTAQVQEVKNGYTDGFVRAQLRVTQVDGNRLLRPFSIYSASFPECETGEWISFSAALSDIKMSENWRSFYADGVYFRAGEIKNFCAAEKFSALRFFARLRLESYARFRTFFKEEISAIAAAICAGEKSGLSGEIKEVFRRAGLSHVLVVSGYHLSFVCGLFYVVLGRFFSRRTAALAALGGMLAYILFVGVTPSVVRAGVAMSIMLAGVLCRRQSDSLTSLGAGALLLTLWNPFSVLDIGLLLSFSATLAVLLIEEAKQAIKRDDKKSPAQQKALCQYVLPLLSSVLVTLATCPVLAAIGGGVSLLSVLTNSVATVLTPFILAGGLLFCAAAPFALLAPLARLAGLACAVSVKLLYAVAQWAARFSWGYVHIAEPTVFAVLGCAGTLLAFLAWKKVPWRRISVLCSLFLFCSIAVYFSLDASVIRVAVAGGTQNASLVFLQRGKAAVFYRGGKSSLAEIEDILARYNCAGTAVLVDLRTNPADLEQTAQVLHAGRVLCAQDVQNNLTEDCFYDIMYTVRHQENGNLACVNAGGYLLGISAGRTDWSNVPALDVYFGGSTQPQGLRARLVLLAEGASWQPKPAAYRWQRGSMILLRKNRSMILREVSLDSA